MSVEKIARNIPTNLRNQTSEKLVDTVLGSPNAGKLPSHLAKAILYYWQKNQLSTEAGLSLLLEACIALEPDKTLGLMGESGLSEAAAMLKEMLQK
jgi:hypothetical protein